MKKGTKTRFRKKRQPTYLPNSQKELRKAFDDFLRRPTNDTEYDLVLWLGHLLSSHLGTDSVGQALGAIIDFLKEFGNVERRGNRVYLTGHVIWLEAPKQGPYSSPPFQARISVDRRGRLSYEIRVCFHGVAWRVTPRGVRRTGATPGRRGMPDLAAFREILFSNPDEVSLFSKFDPVRVRGWKPYPTTETDWVQYRRSDAAACVGHFGEPGLKTLAEALDSDRPEVSAAALDACGSLGKTAQSLWPRVFEHFLKSETLDFRWRVALVAHTMTKTESDVPEIVVRFAHELWGILERQNWKTESPIDLRNERRTVELLARVTFFDTDFRKKVLTADRNLFVLLVFEVVGRELLKKFDAETETRSTFTH